MNPISVPEVAQAGRPECQLVSMGPPPSVSGEDCGTVEMLISPFDTSGPLAGRRQYAYYRPTTAELEHLRGGGFIEFCQIGSAVQPFSAVVWGPSGELNLHEAAELLERVAIGAEGAERGATVIRLVRHATGRRAYADAGRIAQEALDGSTGLDHYRVAQAIATLRIELPV